MAAVAAVEESIVRSTAAILDETRQKFQVIQLIAAMAESEVLRTRVLQAAPDVGKLLEHYELVAEEYTGFFKDNRFSEANEQRAEELELHIRDSFQTLCRKMIECAVVKHVDASELQESQFGNASGDGVVGMTRELAQYFEIVKEKLVAAQTGEVKISKSDQLDERVRERRDLARQLDELQQARAKEDAERKHALQVVDQRIANLTTEIKKLRAISDEKVAALKAREEQEMKPLIESHEKTVADLQEQVTKAKEELAKLAEQNQDAEAAARKKQRIVDRDVDSVVEQYDEEMLSLTGQTEELTNLHNEESTRMATVDTQVRDLIEERRLHEKEEAKKHQEYLEEKARKEEATALIMRAWERFRERAEAKKKKGKKGKGKKKK